MPNLLMALSAVSCLVLATGSAATAQQTREHILLARQVGVPSVTQIFAQVVPLGSAAQSTLARSGAAANCTPVSTSFEALDPQGRVLLSSRTFAEAFASFDTSELNGSGSAFDGEFYIVSVAHELSHVWQQQHCKSILSVKLGDSTFGAQNTAAAEPPSGAPPTGYLIGPIETDTPLLLAAIVHWPSCKPASAAPPPMVIVRDKLGTPILHVSPYGDAAVTTELEGGFTVYTHKLDLPALDVGFATLDLPKDCASYNATTSGDPPLRKELHRVDPGWKIEEGRR
jgi:hypothetical protein